MKPALRSAVHCSALSSVRCSAQAFRRFRLSEKRASPIPFPARPRRANNHVLDTINRRRGNSRREHLVFECVSPQTSSRATRKYTAYMHAGWLIPRTKTYSSPPCASLRPFYRTGGRIMLRPSSRCVLAHIHATAPDSPFTRDHSTHASMI
jgi:hypothetical protein